MQRVNGVPIYWLGNAIGVLFHALVPPIPSMTPIMLKSVFNEVVTAKNSLDFFINQFNALTLSVTAAKEIMSRINGVFSPERLQQENATITEQERGSISFAILNFQAVFNIEVPQLNVFYVTPKRAYDMTVLINTGEKVLSPDTINVLGNAKDEVIADVREATKCLAFSIPTAVGFHIYRAIEAIVVKDYFAALNVPSTEWEDNRNLGNYIRILEKYGVGREVTEMLKHLKNYYRNPIMHPEEFWNADKAESAFNFATSAITVGARHGNWE